MKYLAILSLPVFLLLLAADDKEKKCPISGKPAKDDVFLNVNGEKVHFCCEGCPKAYAKKLNVAKAEGPHKCPVSGKEGKEEHSLIHMTAEKVHFCCNNCPKAFAKKNGFEIKDAGADNQKCPISGKPAKDGEGTSLIVNGEKLYFCCAGCPKGYLKKLGVAASDAVSDCPLSGKPGKKETEQIFVSSKQVNFCCPNCSKGYVKKNFSKEAKPKKAKL